MYRQSTVINYFSPGVPPSRRASLSSSTSLQTTSFPEQRFTLDRCGGGEEAREGRACQRSRSYSVLPRWRETDVDPALLPGGFAESAPGPQLRGALLGDRWEAHRRAGFCGLCEVFANAADRKFEYSYIKAGEAWVRHSNSIQINA